MGDNMISNRYKVIKHIGQGGMADVFVAIDTILNREVAIKVLRGELSHDEISVLRFKREAHASTSLSHPNIVDIYDIGEYKGHHYIVMEYVKGFTLKELIAKRGSLCKEEAVDIMKQLVSATAEAHKRGIIHRDIKPQNVLIKNDGTIKMVDFGIALAQDALQLTQSDAVMGSVHYLAPELAKGEGASVKSDIYSLGIVFYEMLIGDVPFKAEQAVQVALMHMRNEIPNVKSINPDLPQSIENIIIKATAKNKGFRYDSCEDLLDDLKTCLNLNRLNEKKNVLSMPIKNEEKLSEKDVVSHKKIKKAFDPTWIVVSLVAVFLISGIYLLLSMSGFITQKKEDLLVPDIIGLDVAAAKSALDDLSLVLDSDNIVYELNDSTPKGKIISVSPNVDSVVKEGDIITIKVSSGIAAYIGDYNGRRISEVKKELESYKYLNIIVEEEEATDIAGGTILRQELLVPNAVFNPEVATDIKFVIAKYKTIIIPFEIAGMSIEDATKTLQEMGADVMLSVLDTSTMSEEEKANLNTGVVIQTTPAAGTEYTQEDGSVVVIYYY